MGVVFAIVGFVVGVTFGMGVLQLARGGRHSAYRDLVARRPWIRLLSGVCVLACGVVVAVLARGLADFEAGLSSSAARPKKKPRRLSGPTGRGLVLMF
jgi:hypothetical protein